MFDASLDWGGDLAVGSSGDLVLADTPLVTSQRIKRRLLTNPGDYIWQIDYGGGLGSFVGAPAEPAKIEAVVRDQLAMEETVAQNPPPQVTAELVDAANGYVKASIVYFDRSSLGAVELTVTAG